MDEGFDLVPVTRDQAAQLTTLARSLRPHGATRWDEAGIYKAIGAVKEFDAAEVAMVVICAASDRNLDSPGAIGNTKSPLWQHRWRNPEPQHVRAAADKTTTCGVCGKSRDTCARARDTDPDPHDFISVHDTNRAARNNNQPRSTQ